MGASYISQAEASAAAVGAGHPGSDQGGAIASLQLFRGLAAICVVAFHLSIQMALPRYGGFSAFREETKFFDLGVDFFFVLSGFIIMIAHRNDLGRPERIGRYAQRRFSRIYPIYWLYMGAFSALVLLGIGKYAEIPSDAAGWINATLLVRISDTPLPLGVAWTLFHEAAFYVLFAIAIINVRVGAFVGVVWIAFCLWLYQYPAPGGRDPFHVYFAAYNINFALGIVAAELYRFGKFGRVTLASGALLGGLAVLGAYHEWPHYRIAFAVGAALLVAGAASVEKAAKLKVPRPFILAGDASYTIYLVHVPIIGVLLKILGALGLFGLGSIAVFVAALAGVLVLSVPMHLFLEKPLVRLSNRLLAGARRSGAVSHV